MPYFTLGLPTCTLQLRCMSFHNTMEILKSCPIYDPQYSPETQTNIYDSYPGPSMTFDKTQDSHVRNTQSTSSHLSSRSLCSLLSAAHSTSVAMLFLFGIPLQCNPKSKSHLISRYIFHFTISPITYIQLNHTGLLVER